MTRVDRIRAPLALSLSLALMLVAGLSACGKKPKQEAVAPPPAVVDTTAFVEEEVPADTLLAAYEKDRADTREWLKSSPTSYFATILRKDFAKRASLTVGSAADNDVPLQDPAVKLRHLRVTVTGDSFQVQALEPGANFKVKDVEMTSATLPPGSIKLGRYTLRLSHQRYPAIIVFDPKSPRYKLYKGLKYFPPDPSYRVVTSLTPNPNPDTTLILSTRGNQRRAVRVGWFDFKLKGEPCRLEAVRLLEPGVGEKDISLFFTDATTGKESYKVGRYLDVVELRNGRYVLDFNNAYAPACAYSDHYNCPIPSRENRLQVAVRAGEMDNHYMH